MRTIRLKNTVVILAMTAPLWQGCIAHRIMDSEDRKHYTEYVAQTQRINLEREKAKLPPEKVMTFDQWRGSPRRSLTRD
jgi:hypothetical protein